MIVLQLRDLRNIIREALIIDSSRLAASDRGGDFGDSRISLACSSPVNLQQIAADWPVNCLGGCARRKSSAPVTSFAWLSLFFMSTNLYVFSLQTEHGCKHKQQFVFVRQYTGTKTKNEVLCNLSVHISAELDQENFLKKGWRIKWHCPPDTVLEIWALSVWGWAGYLSVPEAPHNIIETIVWVTLNSSTRINEFRGFLSHS